MCQKQSNVFIADDDADMVKLLVERCTALGIATQTASTASEAWRCIEKVLPDVAILDVDMPGGNGLCVSEMMAHHESLRSIPVIMLTGMKNEETIRRCHDLMVYYVEKNADVWPRIEPLLKEFLNVDEQIKLPRPHIKLHEDMAPPAPESNSSESNAEYLGPTELMDAVFAILGEEDEFGDAELFQQDESSRPWVLCIDDDEDFSRVLKLRLEEHGVEVLRAYAGMEGYRRAFLSPAQAIILDYEMPNGNGAYVLSRLKDNPVTRDIPVVVLTGRRDKMLERTMFNLGAKAFLTKPYDWQELWRELQGCLAEAV